MDHSSNNFISDGEQSSTLPSSCTNGFITFIGLIFFFLSLFILNFFKPFYDLIYSTAFSMAFTAAPILLLDVFILKVHRNKSTGINWDIPITISWERILLKLFGFYTTLGFIGFLYWLFPEYHSDFYDKYWRMLSQIFVWALPFAIPYFIWIDGKMIEPKDGYWHWANFLIFRWTKIDKHIVRQHLLGWLIKGFFLPLMLTYLSDNVFHFINTDFSQITTFKNFYDFIYVFVFTVDLAFVSVGYLFSLKIFDTHLRSSESTMFGWVVALLCYQPFWSFFSRNYIAYSDDTGWGNWLSDSPSIYIVWGLSILILLSIYSWASVMFGCRFSNLTHRGIITNGPYRYTKHPAYVTKNLSWWLISVPFIANNGLLPSLKECSLLLLLNGIYYLRAKTEEKHLSNDPNYVQYALWIDKHGVLRFLNKIPILTFIRYRYPLK